MGFLFTLSIWLVGILAFGMLIWFVLYVESSKEKRRNLTIFMAILTALLIGLFAEMLLYSLGIPL